MRKMMVAVLMLTAVSSVAGIASLATRASGGIDVEAVYGGLAARGESLASHRDGRGAPPARRDDREYREYLSEEQRRRRGCIARRMQPEFHHGLPAPGLATAQPTPDG
jgi:hypothetical protein